MDRVQVLKQETAALGGDAADEQSFPAPIEPQEDAIEASGVYFQDASNRDEAVLAWRVGDDLTFKDVSAGTVTLNTLKGGGGGLPPTLVKSISGDISLTEAEVQGNFIIWVDSSVTPSASQIESGVGPFDLSTKTFLRIEDNVSGATEYDLSTSMYWPPPEGAANCSAWSLYNLLFDTFGSIPGYDIQSPPAGTTVIVTDGPSFIGFTQIRALAAVGGGDANDVIGFPTTWQIGTLSPVVTLPTPSGGRTSSNLFWLCIKDSSKTITLKQPGGALIVSDLGSSVTMLWDGSLWLFI